MIYLDNAATTRIGKNSLKRFIDSNERYYGNPSSLHSYGYECEKILKECRKTFGEFIGASPDEVYFTSGGTESNNMAIFGSIKKYECVEVLYSDIDHPSIIGPVEELKKRGVDAIPVVTDNTGSLNLVDLETKLTDRTVLCIFTHVNSELGTLQDMEKICSIIKNCNKSARIHFDCVQSFGKINIDVSRCKVDTLSFSGHKIHGPKGIGGIYVRKGSGLKPIVFGGGQESGLRPGTEPLPLIESFAEALILRSETMDAEYGRIKNLRNKLIEGLKNSIEDIRINSAEKCSPYILNVSIKDIKGEVLLHYLERDKIFISTGSACSSKDKTVDNVVSRLDRDTAYSDGTIRMSFGMFNDETENTFVLEKITEYVNEIRKITRGI
ncbi:cysteine desulfurase [Dethiosulfatibacter aminovorans DSM 17477]|uniref:Cysteine desulfurase n=1 Tax=Dethiosulfatibacter aminovorans DSM 17477 TaxID=1121476 RepID=A0A1M6K1D3_9FIRM|nr:cysteine desulfurase family protein [Dethiosulfatibacter aminovorans]SHJ52793.1 cysteine desulfurase [Dethiosulfatibacter aminovorans DSM 17477]